MKRFLFVLIAVLTAAGFELGATQGMAQGEKLLAAAKHTATVDGDLQGAIAQYKQIVEGAGAHRALAAQALIAMADCYQKLGDAEAQRIYREILEKYADQKAEATVARARLAANSATPKTGVMTRQVWSGQDVTLRGSISGDGRFLSFSDRTGDLAVRNLVSGTNRRLTANVPNTVEYAQESVFSPDGSHIAYSWFNKDLAYELRVLRADSTSPATVRVLYSNPDVGWIGPFDWSSDRDWIAVQIRRKDGTAQIGLVSATDGSLRVLKSVEWRGSTKMFFSPDGRYLAFDLPSSEALNQRDVFALATDGSREVPVAVGPSNDTVIGWSPDGKQLLFTSDRGFSVSLWAASFEGGNVQQAPRLIKPDIGTPVSLGITRAGQLYFGIEAGGSDLKIAPIDLESVTPPTGKAVQAPQILGDNRFPDWSPDGKFLAYNSFRRAAGGTSHVLMIRSVETDQTRELRPGLLSFRDFQWAPDGRSFLVQGTDTRGRQGLFRLDAQTGNVEFVTQGGNALQLSHDGKKVYFRRNTGREQTLFEHDMASGETRELLRGEYRWQLISKDGRYALGFDMPDSGRNELLIVSLPGGTPREFLRPKASERIGISALTPDGKSVVLTKTMADSSSGTEWWLAPLDGGQPRRIYVGASGFNLAIHPDGKMVATQVSNQQRPEVWVMENFLPAPVKK